MPARRAQLIAILAGLVLAAGVAHASAPDHDATLNEVADLNQKALAAYGKGDGAGAAVLLMQALALCERADLANHPAAAGTHLHLGVVYVSGLKKRTQGLAEFRRALAIDPAITIAESLQSPEVQAAFDEAKAGSGLPPSAAPASQPPNLPISRKPFRHSAINHPPVTGAIAGRPVALKVQVPPGLGAQKVVLAYRAEDSDEFLAREMTPAQEAPGWFESEIPATATHGVRVAYYLEAQDADDQPIASSGTPERPHQVALVPETSAATSAADLWPPEPAAAPKDQQRAVDAPAGLWLVLAFGSGGGYYSGTPEMNPVDTRTPPQAIHVSGFGLAGLGHLAPEAGFFPSDKLLISVQGRLQYVTGAQAVVLGPRTYHPAKVALAGLAKLTWFPGAHRSKLRPFVNAQIGAGQIRHEVTTPASANLTGCGPGPTCKDTVMGGLGLAGFGAGFAWMLSPGLGAYAAVNLLAGFPDFMVNGDLNLGIAVLR